MSVAGFDRKLFCLLYCRKVRVEVCYLVDTVDWFLIQDCLGNHTVRLQSVCMRMSQSGNPICKALVLVLAHNTAGPHSLNKTMN